MYLFLLFNLFAISNGYYFEKDVMCNENIKEDCLNNVICSWCNTSTNKSLCKYAAVCASNFTEESNCIYNYNYNSFCNFYEFLEILYFLFVTVCTTYSVSYIVLQNFEDNNRKKNQCALIFTITGLVYIPGFILWFTYSKYLAFYLFSLILISFFTCLFGGARKFIKNKNKDQYYSTIK